MADQQRDSEGNLSGNDGKAQETGGLSLEDFIQAQYDRQREEASGDDGVDAERTANFLARALGESKRMNKEVNKAYQKLDNLHSNFPAGIFDAWREEHAAEALSPEAVEAVRNASHPNGANINNTT